jgi:hypothetical protein
LTGNAFGTINRFGLNFVPPNYHQGFEARSPVLDIKGKGKIKETDFDAAFAQVVSSLETASVKVEPTSGSVDPVEELEKAFNQAAKLDDVPVVTPEEALHNVEFKRCVGVNASTCDPDCISTVASGTRCRIPTCHLIPRNLPDGRQSSINL